jgi:hypothetical protein
MDRGELSEAIIQELAALWADALRAAAPELLTADLDGIEARLQQVNRTVCGATLERVLAVRAVPRGERPPGPTCGGLLRLVDQARARHLQGLTGEATLRRPTYVCVHAGGVWARACAPGCGTGPGGGDADAAAGAGGVPRREHRGVR